MAKLIIVSNRLPFHIHTKKNGPAFTSSDGGLVTCLTSYIQESYGSKNKEFSQIVWIGSTDIAEPKFREMFNSDSCTHDNITVFPVFLSTEIRERYSEGFSNNTLWPLFHYFPSYTKFNDHFYEGYKSANETFAKKIIEIFQEGDLIWIHDYHLMLTPAIIRTQLPSASIGFFLHIPFPSYELFRLLPNEWRRNILEGLLGADVVGFHTNDYVQHFTKSVVEILGYEHSARMITGPDRSILTEVFPVSIDFGKFSHAVNDREVFGERNDILKKMDGTRLIISVDRLDYTKALVNRLESFELFLENHTEYIGKVTFVMTVVPSRSIITKYRENKHAIEQTVSRLNGRFGHIHWTPVVYQYRQINFTQLVGLYLAADVALITPIRDGMNLVAKEFVASRTDHKGVLILSETTGAARELGEAILVNPTHRLEIAGAIKQALDMDKTEQTKRIIHMQKRLRQYDVTRWAEDFIGSIHFAREIQHSLKVKEISEKIRKEILMHYSRATKRVLLLDYDGTLTSFAETPEQAKPGKQQIELLQSLCEDEKNDVVLISGRQMENLEKWFGFLPVHLAAEHGAFLRMKGMKWESMVASEQEWKKPVSAIMQKFTERCASSFVEEKQHTVAWHYRKTEKELGFQRSRELIGNLSELLSDHNISIMDGNKVVEAKTRGINKGTAALRWLADTDAKTFILAIGDDKTDEDLFKSIPDYGYSIRVGLTSTSARLNAKNPEEVLSLLTAMSHTQKYESPISEN